MLVGDNVTRGRMKSLNLNRNRVGQAAALRKKIPTSAKSCWTYTERKTRSDAIRTEHRKLAHKFWSSPEISRTKPDKKNFVRIRWAAETWVSHQRQMLEKTQTEVYLEFKENFLHVQIGQRAFECCKPFYVSAPQKFDWVSCCCRAHVETRMVFQFCMDFRRKLLSPKQQRPVFDPITTILEEKLCPKEESSEYQAKASLLRE